MSILIFNFSLVSPSSTCPLKPIHKNQRITERQALRVIVHILHLWQAQRQFSLREAHSIRKKVPSTVCVSFFTLVQNKCIVNIH